MANLATTRGARLARKAPVGDEPVREFLAFSLADEVYAVELALIREIVSPPLLTGVPRAPEAVMGVCSVRGLLVTVIDLRHRLRIERRPPTRLSRILLVYGRAGEVIGLFVDEVRHVLRLAESHIEIASSVLGGDLSEHVVGIGRVSNEVIVLLDLASVTS